MKEDTIKTSTIRELHKSITDLVKEYGKSAKTNSIKVIFNDFGIRYKEEATGVNLTINKDDKVILQLVNQKSELSFDNKTIGDLLTQIEDGVKEHGRGFLDNPLYTFIDFSAFHS